MQYSGEGEGGFRHPWRWIEGEERESGGHCGWLDAEDDEEGNVDNFSPM